MTVPWTRFQMQVPSVSDTVEFYLNTLSNGPVELEEEAAPWADAWFWGGDDGWRRPRQGEPMGHLTPDHLAEFDGAEYGGLGGCSELEIMKADSARVQGHPFATVVPNVEALRALHQQRGVTVLKELGEGPFGRRGYTIEDLNGYHLRLTEGDPEVEDYAIEVVPDLQAAVDYYVNVLGFSDASYWGDPALFARVRSPCIEFWENPELAAQLSGHQIPVYVADVDADYEKHRSTGAKIVQKLELQPWGSRAYEIEDPNGYVLRFAGS